MTTSLNSFDPHIHGPDNNQYYDDGLVSGAVESCLLPGGRRSLRIDEWNSVDPGKGHADRALRWLRQTHSYITANGIGTIDDDGPDTSVLYWERQYEKGLVDELLLDDGSIHMKRPLKPTVIKKQRKFP